MMGERCTFCGLPLLHGPGLYCDGASTCKERRAFEAGQEAGYLVCLDYEARARAIRAVVAAQWGVACVLFHPRGYAEGSIPPCYLGNFSGWQEGTTEAVADLPTAEQIVDGAASKKKKNIGLVLEERGEPV